MTATNRRVVATQHFIDQATIDYLKQSGCDYVQAELPEGQADGNLTQDELVERLSGAAGWIVGHGRVTRELLAELPDLQIISRRGVGFDRVDTAAVDDAGKVACIAVGGNHDTVADHAIAMMLAVGHRFRETQNDMIGGTWKILQGNDLFRKTVGIIGLGRIGRSIVQRLSGFDCEVLAVDDYRDEAYAAENDVSYVKLDELLTRSDYVTVHAPLTDATRTLIDAGALAKMKPSAFLVNAARGGLVDDAALLAALEAGNLAGAALDTFQSEADASLKSVTQALIERPNVIATPHSAASTVEGLARTNMVAAKCIVAVLDGGDPPPECVIADGRK
jgi:D-3-phosphoglycerate dehydrogenase